MGRSILPIRILSYTSFHNQHNHQNNNQSSRNGRSDSPMRAKLDNTSPAMEGANPLAIKVVILKVRSHAAMSLAPRVPCCEGCHH